ncbi:hypothetical protein [Alphaproteobacteria bacterium endosymbiont of Tiliacea citrago]|uniref:inositol monophosphatase family protein n=1 Tax=Alphaproteobacteria bacterium endosymbiont of Tiliacea citrago TaxID=3077944 RepID=UPI00313ABA97
MFPHSIIKKLKSKIIYHVSSFCKRDYLEVRFIKDAKKLKIFYLESIKRSMERVERELLVHNKSYGIYSKDSVLVEGIEKTYWNVEIIDNYENFANNLVHWGISIALMNEEKIMSISYYIPFLDEFFYCAEEEGCFLNDRKITLSGSSKIVLGVGTKKTPERKLGSDILSIMYTACDRFNITVLENTSFNEKLSKLVMKETRGGYLKINNKIIIGNELAVNSISITKS